MGGGSGARASRFEILANGTAGISDHHSKDRGAGPVEDGAWPRPRDQVTCRRALSEGVPDRSAETGGVVRAVVRVVVDPVIASLGANEEALREIKLKAATEIYVEVVAR